MVCQPNRSWQLVVRDARTKTRGRGVAVRGQSRIATPYRLLAAATMILWELALAATAPAGDWPQILGPRRNGQAEGEILAESWPARGPKPRWTHDVGAGFAGPVVSGKRVVIFHRVENEEVVEALDTDTGQRAWRTSFPASYRGGVNPDLGPRCTPLVHEGNIYLFGAAGDLSCVALADGKKLWTRNVSREYQADEGYFGAGSTPIIVDGRLLVNVGGRRKQAGIVAFSLDGGEPLWQATEEGASYSAPTSAVIDGKACAIFATRLSALAITADKGDVLFRFPFGDRGPTVNAATPLVFDEHLFLSASYGIGARLDRLDGHRAVNVWSNDKALSSQYTTAVHRNGFLYGTDGREDVRDGNLRCVEVMTGKVRWRVDGFGVAHVILAGDKLLILNTSGQLTLAKADPDAFQKLAEARVSRRLTRALPALSAGNLLFRDNGDDQRSGTVTCLVVGRE